MAVVWEDRGMSESMSFESALEKLQLAVKRLEAGDLPLEDALKQFEEGVRLSRLCTEQLTAAEQKVEQLMRPTTQSTAAGPAELQPFNPNVRG